VNDAPKGSSTETEGTDSGLSRPPEVPRKQRMRLLATHTFQDAVNLVLNLGIIVVAVVFLGLLVASTFQKKTEIELISAPKTFAEEEGYSPDVAARKLEDAVDDIVTAMERSAAAPQSRALPSQPQRSLYQPIDIVVGTGQQPAVALVSDRPTIVLPGVGVSLDSLASVFQSMLCPTCREVITGEFTFVGKHLWLIVRANNHVVFANQEGGDPNQPDILLHQAAIALFDAVYPASGAIAHNNLGNEKYRQAKMDDAIGEYRVAIKLDPGSMIAHYNLGNALRDQGDLNGAIAAYRTAIQIDPGDSKTHTNLGIVLASQGKTDDAITEYRTAINLDPKNADAQTNLGTALKAQGKQDEAIAQYHAATDLDPTNPYTYSNLGSALLAQGKTDQAIDAFRKAIALGGQGSALHFNLGLALATGGHFNEAVNEYEQAIALNPKDSYSYANLGAAFMALGKYDQALGQMRQSALLNGANGILLKNFGYLLSRQGQQADAIAAYQTGLKIDPTDAYKVMLLHIVRVASKQDDHAELAENAARLKPGSWPMPVVAYFLGTADEEAMRKAAASGDPNSVLGQKCEADYYSGALLLAKSQLDEARPLIKAAASECPPDFFEKIAAKIDLAGMPPG
jgi:tetratricopeptide (TPR) repeat protein